MFCVVLLVLTHLRIETFLSKPVTQFPKQRMQDSPNAWKQLVCVNSQCACVAPVSLDRGGVRV